MYGRSEPQKSFACQKWPSFSTYTSLAVAVSLSVTSQLVPPAVYFPPQFGPLYIEDPLCEPTEAVHSSDSI
jgi:hypothetical protein